jgi:hypothetical protein
MKFLLQILFFFLTWFTNLVNETPVFTEGAFSNYELVFSKTENVTEKNVVKIGVQNPIIIGFARSGIEYKNKFSNILRGEVWACVSCFDDEVKVLQGAGSRVARTIEQIAPNGIIPSNSQTNNLFHKWFDDLIPEELDLVLSNPTLKEALEARIRYPGGLHEWCMVCEIKTFKNWEISMSEIHRFRTKTLDLTGVNPTTGATFVHGGAGSTAFHNELRTMIQSSTSLADFNTRLAQLVNRWQIDPSLLPPLIR